MTELSDFDTQSMQDPDARSVFLHGREIIIVHADGGWRAYLNNCPHINLPLNFIENDFLDRERQYIVCANHGALFQMDDGLCVSGPCQGQALYALACELRGDKLYVDDRSWES